MCPCCLALVVNCFKMCIFALARTTHTRQGGRPRSCELLQNVYLCISTYNALDWLPELIKVVNCFKMCIFALARTTLSSDITDWVDVVNCFKMCIFALARTTAEKAAEQQNGCELLQNVYLCISTYNYRAVSSTLWQVVNCFKMCIFALARTTVGYWYFPSIELWIASKCVSLH